MKYNILFGLLIGFITLGVGVNATPTCDNPGYCCQNQQCNFTVTFFNQSSGAYISDGSCLLSINNVNGTNYLTNGQMTNNTGGVYNYSLALSYTGNYNYVSVCSLGNVTGSSTAGFIVQAPKIFLMEIYLMFEVVAFVFFIMGLKSRKSIYPLVAMFIFLTLAILGFYVEELYTSTSALSWEAIMFNFSFGIIAFLYTMFSYTNSIKELGKKDETI